MLDKTGLGASLPLLGLEGVTRTDLIQSDPGFVANPCLATFNINHYIILFLSSINSRNFICLWANILWQDIHHDGRPAK